MSIKLIWTGMALMMALPMFVKVQGLGIAGAIIMIIGVILLWLGN